MFVAQLVRRATLLNGDFQRRIVHILSRHAINPHSPGACAVGVGRTPCPRSIARSHRMGPLDADTDADCCDVGQLECDGCTLLECRFGSDCCEERGWLEIHSAPVKRVERSVSASTNLCTPPLT